MSKIERPPTTWYMFQCERGNRWTSPSSKVVNFNMICNFSGCKQDHTYRLVDTTSDVNEAHNWFLNFNEWSRIEHERHKREYVKFPPLRGAK